MIWLLFLKTEITLYLFVFFYGIFHGGRNVAWMGILGEFFGMRSLGELIGISDAVAEVVAAFGPYFAGFLFDRTGSYFMSFLLIMVLLLAAGLVATSITKPQIAPR
jgi:cyanate permease